MYTDHQANLDDLVSSCRSDNARVAFAEAVACYKAGAYRAAIVTTWTAIVYDYLGKLRELELVGNGDAKTLLIAFDTARQNNDTAQLLGLERNVLDDAAAKFELLTPIEKQDLERVQLDRHRCAHPSLLTLDDPYRPTAELARCHMRNAVHHLLSRPPLQGQEAWARLWADVESEFFPEDEMQAVERLRVRISRARTPLVNRFVIELTKALLDPTKDRAADGRLFAALLAVTKLYHQEVEGLLSKKLEPIADQVADTDLGLLLTYTARCELAWPVLGSVARRRLEAFVAKTDSASRLTKASRITVLWATVVPRLSSLTGATLADLCRGSKRVECFDEVVRRFETSKSYKTFAALKPLLKDDAFTSEWSKTHAERLTVALKSNSELKSYYGFSDTVCEVLRLSGNRARDFEQHWREIYDLLLGANLAHPAERVREFFPMFPAPPTPPAEQGVADTEPDESSSAQEAGVS